MQFKISRFVGSQTIQDLVDVCIFDTKIALELDTLILFMRRQLPHYLHLLEDGLHPNMSLSSFPS